MTGSTDLVSVLDLGNQHLTGIFPREPNLTLAKGPLQLVLCTDGGLLQLRHSNDLSEMYGESYGYRSGLNASMVAHLAGKVRQLEAIVRLQPGDVVLDIGSNDATLLRSYANVGQLLGGIDPSAQKFRQFYPPHVGLVPDFFSREAFRELFGEKRAAIVTSIAMLYDLEAPLEFARTVSDILAKDGIWHFEQSYMPSMLEACAYDTVCHEHLEYYGLTQIKWIADQSDLKIIDVELNDTNGGSFAVTVAKRNSKYQPNILSVEKLLAREQAEQLNTPEAFSAFREAVFQHRTDLSNLIARLRDDGKRVFGYGASTKGNVLLQFCGFTAEDLTCIADVNPDKYGCFTPGSNIPIVSESDARAQAPDYFLVLPWHFRKNILSREHEFLERGGKMIFPLPKIDVVG